MNSIDRNNEVKVALMGGGSTLAAYLMDRLIENGTAVRCLLRSKAKALSLPYEVECVLGCPDNYTSLENLFNGAHIAFVFLPPSYDEARQGINALEVAKNAGVKKIVYLSSMMPWNSRHLPLFRNKVRIEEFLRGLTLPYTILRPNFSFQSILNFEREIMDHGIYPFPIGHYGVSQVDLRDVAEAAYNAIISEKHNWKEYALCGPEALSGDDISAILSDVLGRKIIYGGNDIRKWKHMAERFMPKAMVDEWTNIFGFLQQEGLFPDRGDLLKQRDILSHELIAFNDFAEELAIIWKNRELAEIRKKAREKKHFASSKRRSKAASYHHHSI